MALTRTTELQAVNIMMSAIGEAPVNSLIATEENLLPTDVVLAKSILEEVSKETQMIGWNFNREVGFEISPTVENEIVIPSNAASVDVEPVNSRGTQYIQRGDKLYNKTDHTFTITTTIKCTIIYMLEWEDLPQTARHYMAIKAGRRLQDRTVGSELHHRFAAQDEMQALVALKESETEGGDYTIFDNYDVFRVINRGNVINRMVS